ncbi:MULTISPECIES: RNA polymerase factor sigma-54 [Bacillus]|uniref:RNA polymerase factor sigma-54 n=2 Tax=Bacillus pseudomycoides TaxID=64104 RepID=A0AAJ3RCH5_9BACI|nr:MULTISPECIES: RNA polymerase factor sigma-54 [Bacillus]AIK38717.1 RNA polymerase sigma-54 factor [Bacillus pseudomycoides]AJI18313.1 RNA polymerase sigma-54 factor [Bacillus pseudomycoides]KFN16009.1 RNA polymerase sigma-54 factor [Bacillus pseudomycoides]MBD5796147.1 RNA polymerase factor sigma-54 [Bacillus pseudomycoides]MCR8858298.1 RNA polymerase factor sigma-54 [Bacillus pseudomycoides]
MKASLLQEQSLRLAMTQELRQAITMLQYNVQELSEFLYEQSLENPLIELGGFEREKKKSSSKSKSTSKQVNNQMEIYSVDSTTIQQHLLDQIQYYKIDEEQRKAASFIIMNMDENGYLQETNEELAELLAAHIDVVDCSMELVQSLEPAGVGARNIQECLSLQLKRLQKRDELAEMIVDEHFVYFVKKDWRKLIHVMKCNNEELQSAVDCITSLQPKPGLAFSSEKPLYIVPDMAVKKDGDRLVLQMNERNMPRIEIHSEYSALLHNSESEVASYVSEKYQHVQWIMRSLKQRKQTLLQVMEIIMKKQRDFFWQGPEYLKPLSLKEVAEELSVHESTISRATRNKYVQTPHGLFEMKSFFSNAVVTTEDEAVSTKRVKQLMQALVEKENKKKPLSDQKISKLLEEEHEIVISRRTVAKYREQMNIPASSLRKTIG